MKALSDQKILELCQLYGKRALIWRQKFIGLLPEVQKRHLYKQRGFKSIFEFAFKWAGLSEQQIKLALKLDIVLEDKPKLHEAFITGSVSINKLARIVSIANTENEQQLCDLVKTLPRQALETFVRDERRSFKPLLSTALHVQDLNLSQDLLQSLKDLQDQGHDLNELLTEFLTQREEKLSKEAETLNLEIKPTSSRHVPAKIKRWVKNSYGSKCSLPYCSKTAAELHHTQRFSLSHSHDPHFLAPLCKQHHQIAHTIDQKTQAHWVGT